MTASVSPPQAPAQDDPLLAAVRRQLPDFTTSMLAAHPRTTVIFDERGAKWEVEKRAPFPPVGKLDPKATAEDIAKAAVAAEQSELTVFQIFPGDEDGAFTIYAVPGEKSRALPTRYTLHGKRMMVESIADYAVFFDEIATEFVEILGGGGGDDPDEDADDEDDGLEAQRAELKLAFEDAKMLNEVFNRADGRQKLLLEPGRLRAHDRLIVAAITFGEELKLDDQARAEIDAAEEAAEKEAAAGAEVDSGGDSGDAVEDGPLDPNDVLQAALDATS